jgi:hypothetical protein
MDQQSLIDRSLNGDLNAFNQLVIDYQNLAYSVAYRRSAAAASKAG